MIVHGKGWSMLSAMLLACLLFLAAPALAEPPPPPEIALEDPRLEARAQSVMVQLRCITCQDQSIAESHANQAQAMRVVVRERIAAGETPDEVRAFFIERYGDWVSYVPPRRMDTLLLWLAPLLFLLFGGVVMWRRISK